MLMEFSVGNFRSFRERQALSLVKAKGNELADTNTFKVSLQGREVELLRSAVIYGPNAGGKTSLLQALNAMRAIVLRSAATVDSPVISQRVEPFLLDEDSCTKPSEFEVTIIFDGVRYQYGFSASKERIHEEWLFACKSDRPQRWFVREWDGEKYAWGLGGHLKGEKKMWQSATRADALFLTTAVQNNSEQLKPVFNWFKQLCVLPGNRILPDYTAAHFEGKDRQSVLSFLREADLGILDVRVKHEQLNFQDLPKEMPQELKNLIMGAEGKADHLRLETVHQTKTGKEVVFDLNEESDGTQRLFGMIGPWLDILKNGGIVFIDELNQSLHPQLVRFLIRIIHNTSTNPNNAQLVFTTHETTVMDDFRRDQIWFCEREDQRASVLTPLSDFSARTRENFERSYLSGRYGGLPFIGSVEAILR